VSYFKSAAASYYGSQRPETYQWRLVIKDQKGPDMSKYTPSYHLLSN